MGQFGGGGGNFRGDFRACWEFDERVWLWRGEKGKD